MSAILKSLETDYLALQLDSYQNLIISFKTKACSGAPGLLSSLKNLFYQINTHPEIQQNLNLRGLIIWQPEPKFFCVGADLSFVVECIRQKKWTVLHGYISMFQQVSMAIRHSVLPVVAAMSGYALGGGCEIALHCHYRVVTADLKMGLVETGIGLVPAGAGTKEMIARSAKLGGSLAYLKSERPTLILEAVLDSKFKFSENFTEQVRPFFENIACAKMSNNAEEAKKLGYLMPEDQIVETHDVLLANAQEILKQHGGLLSNNKGHIVSGFDFLEPVFMEVGTANIEAALITAYRKMNPTATEYDLTMASRVAHIFSGESASKLMSEDQVLANEIKYFMASAQDPKTLERLEYVLKKGKHLHN